MKKKTKKHIMLFILGIIIIFINYVTKDIIDRQYTSLTSLLIMSLAIYYSVDSKYR